MDETKASRAAGARIAKALRCLLDEARTAGCKNPGLFFEAESAAVFVLDRDHPAYKQDRTNSQPAIVLRAPIATPFDTGAW